MATNHGGAFSLVKLSSIALGIFALSSVLAVTALLGVRSSSEKAVLAWRQFSDQASAEQRALRGFVTQAGLAGFIDDYHRLAATGDEALVPAVYARGGAALSALSTYPVETASEAEIAARATLQSLIRSHMQRVGAIIKLHQSGRPVAEILAAADIKGDDARLALETIGRATTRSMMKGVAQTDSKALILLDVRRLLGIEGVTQDADRVLVGSVGLDRLRADIAAVQAALERYRRHPLTVEETAVLERLAKVVSEVEPALIAAKGRGQVVFDSRKLQASLLELEMIVYSEAMTAQANLQSTLNEVSRRAGAMIFLLGGGAVVLIAGAAWLLVFRIGGRIKAITDVMRDLANGKLDAEIPASDDHDEIGEMSRALLVFSDSMRANAVLTAELAENSRLASLGAMVAGMAHELNTPIGNALAVSSTLEEECKTFRKDLGSERLLRSMLERHASNLEDAAMLIQRNLVRAAEQIDSFKQVAVDQTSGKRRDFYLDEVLSNIVQSLQPVFKRTPFTLKLGEASGVAMDSYPGALSQVITNLVENGLKHGLAGRESGKVVIQVRRAGPLFTEIIVEDDGAGIPDAIKPSIFNAFFTTKAGKGGSGLGLHIAKSIVCGPLGGQISVQSAEVGGTRFILSIPNKAPAEEPGSEMIEEGAYYAAA